MDDPNRPETEEDGVRAGQLRILKARHQSRVFQEQTRALSPSGVSAIPPGLEFDPIALQLQKMGRPVTREAWLMLDQGTSDETNLDSEMLGFLNRVFPQET